MRQKITGISASVNPELGVVVPHSLGVVPYFVMITAKANARFWLTNATAFSITVASNVIKANFEVNCLLDHSLMK